MAKARKTAKKTSKPKGAAAKKKTYPKPAARPKVVRSRESKQARQERSETILAELRKAYPDATCALHHNSAYELLAAVILSAQCTDERVNMVTPNLFRLYPTPAALAKADQADIEALIRSTGFYRNKAKNLLAMAQAVVRDHGGEIPDEMDDLLKLAGVARKTANCVLGQWFGKNVGVVVDTHVGRLALRLRLLTTARDDKDAVKIERDLMELFPQESWTYLSHALIDHGREVCDARKPKCETCTLGEVCPTRGKW